MRSQTLTFRNLIVLRLKLTSLIIFATFSLGVQADSDALKKDSISTLQNDAMAPNCTLTSVDGKQIDDMQQFQGKVLYVDFWASWCGPCAQSFPFLNDLNREFRGQGLQVLGINVDEKSKDAQTFLLKHPANFKIAADASGKCPEDFGVKAMPSTYLIDRNGVIRYIHLGFRPSETKKLRAMVEQLLAENVIAQKNNSAELVK
jgi:DsbE subfamily thiol:disulfide oxidoreductase